MQLTGFAQSPTALPAQLPPVQVPLLRPAFIAITDGKSEQAWLSLWCPGPRLPLKSVLFFLCIVERLLYNRKPLRQRLPRLKGTGHRQQPRIGTQCIVQFLILPAITGDPQQWHLLLTQPPEQDLPAGQHEALDTDGQLLAACVQPLLQEQAHDLLLFVPAAGGQGVCLAFCCPSLQSKGQVRLPRQAVEHSAPRGS